MSCPLCTSQALEFLRPIFVEDEPFYDRSGNKHIHDERQVMVKNLCLRCNHRWTTIQPNTCPCGWIQGIASGYEGVRMKNKPWGCGCMKV